MLHQLCQRTFYRLFFFPSLQRNGIRFFVDVINLTGIFFKFSLRHILLQNFYNRTYDFCLTMVVYQAYKILHSQFLLRLFKKPINEGSSIPPIFAPDRDTGKHSHISVRIFPWPEDPFGCPLLLRAFQPLASLCNNSLPFYELFQ